MPNSGSGYDLGYFADPYAIRFTMQNNWLDTGGSSYKQQEIISAVINGSATVLASGGATSYLPTKPSTPIYDYVADELSPKASFSGSAGWSSYTNSYGYNRSHSVAFTSGNNSTVTATTTWKFEDLEPGQYEVWASWVQGSGRSTKAPFTVYDGTENLGTVRVNQTLTPDYHDSGMVPSLGNTGWGRIGDTFQIDGNTLIVTLTNNTDESWKDIVADAIRIRRKATIIADDDGAGYSETSGWTNYAGVKDVGYERDHSAASTVGSSSSATAKATWTFGNITPGEYEVWVTWVSASNRANDAPFTIKDGSTSRGTLRVDQSKAPNASDSGMYEQFDGTYWRKLSSIFRVDGTQLVVELANNAESGKYVVADAVRIKRKASTVMNDRDENFLASPSSNWTLYSGSSITGFRNGHYVASTSGSPGSTTATATWTFGSLDPGQYEVWVTWVTSSNRSVKAPYTVKDGSTVRHTQAINQSQDPGSVSGNEYFESAGWVKLSSVVDIYSGSLVVQLTNNTDESGKYVIADGVRIKKVASLLLDDADLGFAATKTGADSWEYYGAPTTPGYANDHHVLKKTSSGAGSVANATWTFDNLVAGATYAIYAIWLQSPYRTDTAPFYANSTLLNTIDQSNSPGYSGSTVWVNGSEFRLLNTYYHTSGSLVVKLDTNVSALNEEFVADAIHIRRVSPLQSSSSGPETTQQGVDLLDSVPTSIINEAIARWSSTGLSAAQIDLLRSASVTVVDLAPGYLGVSDGKDVVIDRDGDGRGWFIDSTPGDDSEFLGSGLVNQSAFDLLTLMMHEFGHVLGFSDKEGESDDLMSESITPGVRKIPAGRLEPASQTKSISIPTETSSSVRNARVQRMLDRIEFREQRIAQIKTRIASRPVQTGQSLTPIGRFSNPRTRFRPVN